jgi:hypothetical protein
VEQTTAHDPSCAVVCGVEESLSLQEILRLRSTLQASWAMRASWAMLGRMNSTQNDKIILSVSLNPIFFLKQRTISPVEDIVIK